MLLRQCDSLVYTLPVENKLEEIFFKSNLGKVNIYICVYIYVCVYIYTHIYDIFANKNFLNIYAHGNTNTYLHTLLLIIAIKYIWVTNSQPKLLNIFYMYFLYRALYLPPHPHFINLSRSTHWEDLSFSIKFFDFPCLS